MSARNRDLPPEILSDIICFLDPTADRTTLYNLLLVSHAVNNIALPVLYKCLTLNAAQFGSLVVGACDQHGRFTPSSSPRFSLIQHLTLCPPPSADTMAPVYAAIAGAVDLLLFPSVRTLCLDHCDHWQRGDYSFRRTRDSRWGGPPGLPPSELALFDCPDVCIRGQYFAVDALAYLPSRTVSTSSLTVHTGSLDAITTSTIPRGWRHLVVYHTDIELLQMSSEREAFTLVANPVVGYAQEPVIVYLNKDDKREGHIRRMLDFDAQYPPYWAAPPPECLLFDDDAPPCKICGMSARRIASDFTGRPQMGGLLG